MLKPHRAFNFPQSFLDEVKSGIVTQADFFRAVNLREEVLALFDEQKEHPVYKVITPEIIKASTLVMGVLTGLEAMVKELRGRAESVDLMASDPYEYGYEPPAWDEIDWLVCQKRVENPGVVIKPLIMGGNGGGKTFFCASRFVRTAVENKGFLMWSFSYDEQSSRRIPQPACYRFLPKSLRPDSGKLQKTATTKLNWNGANGFTDNTFAPPSGTVVEYRFFSSDIEKMEGPRPHGVWWDEEAGLPWVDAMTKRLHSRAEATTGFVESFKLLLQQKAENPALKFPRERLHDLYLGVNIGSFTPTRGYTATVKRYIDEAVTIRTVEATLLPIKDGDGNITGCEKTPKVQMCKDPTAFVYYLHAWDNPFGGNWKGMQIEAKKMTREDILWWVYGVATKTAGTPFPMFSRAAHVRPLSLLTKSKTDLTIYHVVDPVANGGRAWFMQWIGITPLGDKFIIREFPQLGEFVEGVGTVGEWALQGGKDTTLGKRGPAQDSWSYGFAEWAAQIKRIERELAHELGGDAIEVEARIMDSRSGNTVSLSSSGGKTLIQCMEDEGYYFTSAGKDTPNAGSNRFTSVGEQIIKDALFYDVEKATFDAETGLMMFAGKAPKLYIRDTCRNTIDAFANYPGANAGNSAWDDCIDCIRYCLIADPEYVNPETTVTYVCH